MPSKKLLFLTLLTFNWTVLSVATYAQTNPSGQDSSCFTRQEKEQIALQLIEGNECDTLLSVCEEQLLIADTIRTNLEKKNGNLNKEISNKNKELYQGSLIVNGLEKDNMLLRKQNLKLQRKKNWLTFTLGGLSLSLGLGFLIYAVTHP